MIEIASKHIEDRFLEEITNTDSIEDKNAKKRIDELTGYYRMICHGIMP